jgi:DNA-binding Xre family transcriptional regulator
MLRFRLKERLAEKELREGQRTTLLKMGEDIGIGAEVLSSLGSPHRQVVTNTAYLEAICRYLGCTMDELVVFVPEVGQEESCHVDELYPDRRS